MNKMLPCPCCGRAVFGEWKSRTDLGLGWIKGEYEIFCGCGLRMVASANVEAKNLNHVMTMAAQSWNARMIPPTVRDLALPGRGYTPFHRTGPKTDMATIVLLRVSGNRIEEWCGSHWRWSTPNPEILHRPCSAQGNARPWEN